MKKNQNIFSSLRLRQIINDLKRRPQDAASDLKMSLSSFNSYLKGNKNLDVKFVKKAVDIWPVNINDFINTKYHKAESFKIMRVKDSIKTKRIMKRGGNDYYEYRDTVMDRNAPFRPEWIRQLIHVKTNSPYEKSLMWNRGHLLHQLTYFVGKINFYYIDSSKKKRTAVMNTGDSMYIAPYVPHTFASRDKNCEGYIIAITFSDKISNNIQDEISNYSTEKIHKIIFEKKIKLLKKITIKKFKNIKKKNTKFFDFYKLANNKIIPSTRFEQINVKKNNLSNFSDNYHQYLYILSKEGKLKIEKKTISFSRGDTIYIRPFTNYKILNKGTKVLAAKVESVFNKEARDQMYHIGKNNFGRLIKDNSQWFKQ